MVSPKFTVSDAAECGQVSLLGNKATSSWAKLKRSSTHVTHYGQNRTKSVLYVTHDLDSPRTWPDRRSPTPLTYSRAKSRQARSVDGDVLAVWMLPFTLREWGWWTDQMRKAVECGGDGRERELQVSLGYSCFPTP